MFFKLSFIVVLIKTYTVKETLSQYLESELNPQTSQLEKNNIVNKGVWIRSKPGDDHVRVKAANFIFRENSMDIDNLLQNSFDAFAGNNNQETPLAFVPSYSDRQKRSSRYKRPRKSITGKNIRSAQNFEYERTDGAQGKITNNVKPSLVFNDYPYEVAILLNGTMTNENEKYPTMDNYDLNDTTTVKTQNDNVTIELTTVAVDKSIDNTINDTIKNITSPKRSMKYDFETEIIKKIEYTEDLNKTDDIGNNDNKINDRNVFDKDNSEWHQTAPIPDVNIYKVVPKEPMQKSKPVTERGLLKVISMLTKTFKKMIKQHNEIKDIHNKITEMSEDFKRRTVSLIGQLQNFDHKYLYLIKLHDEMKEFDSKMSNHDQYLVRKEKEMNKGFKEFENQQKKFLLQQKQFYNIQKLMLAQNEKINQKQNLIAKTQSEISHRQNNFARILKKAKQLYTDNKNTVITKLSSSISKLKGSNQKHHEHHPVHTTKAPEKTTESIKINLFSIPTSNKIQEDPDDMILREKDEQAIDDLVYKYYFNNTFIDSFMKSKILNSFMGGDHTAKARVAKNKRNNIETTILLPIIDTNESATAGLNRHRRWINRHHSKHQTKRRNYKKTTPTPTLKPTEPPKDAVSSVTVNVPLNVLGKDHEKDNNNKGDSLANIAKTFCNQIRQNANPQMLNWCIEKSIRKLEFLEQKLAQQPVLATNVMPAPAKNSKPLNNKQKPQTSEYPTNEHIVKKVLPNEIKTTTNGVVSKIVTTNLPDFDASTISPIQLSSVTLQTFETAYATSPTEINLLNDILHFPDNDELEMKLKEYELEPDTKGNVYYEGSVHASDLLDGSDSGVDDIMPGLDSNSRFEVDPLTFDLQAKRRAYVWQMNERIKKTLL